MGGRLIIPPGQRCMPGADDRARETASASGQVGHWMADR